MLATQSDTPSEGSSFTKRRMVRTSPSRARFLIYGVRRPALLCDPDHLPRPRTEVVRTFIHHNVTA